MLAFLGVACGPQSFDDEEDLWTYLKDPGNGYLQSKTINGVDYSLLYKPTDLLVQQELGSQADLAALDSLRRKYDQYCYFNLSMSRGDQELLNSVAGDRQAFGAMVNQLAFGMADKIHLHTQERDTIELIDYVYPRMYGMSRNTSLLLVYPRDEILATESITVSVEDLGFGTGEVSFRHNVAHILEQPRLRF